MLTERKYYEQEQARHPDYMMLMKHWESYYILGDRAEEAIKIIRYALTHKHAGEMFCYDTENYGYKRLSFGKHNLDIVLRELIRSDIRCLLCDYDKAFRDSGGWEEIDMIFEQQKREQEEKERRKPVQTSLFDLWEI